MREARSGLDADSPTTGPTPCFISGAPADARVTVTLQLSSRCKQSCPAALRPPPLMKGQPTKSVRLLHPENRPKHACPFVLGELSITLASCSVSLVGILHSVYFPPRFAGVLEALHGTLGVLYSRTFCFIPPVGSQ